MDENVTSAAAAEGDQTTAAEQPPAEGGEKSETDAAEIAPAPADQDAAPANKSSDTPSEVPAEQGSIVAEDYAPRRPHDFIGMHFRHPDGRSGALASLRFNADRDVEAIRLQGPRGLSDWHAPDGFEVVE